MFNYSDSHHLFPKGEKNEEENKKRKRPCVPRISETCQLSVAARVVVSGSRARPDRRITGLGSLARHVRPGGTSANRLALASLSADTRTGVWNLVIVAAVQFPVLDHDMDMETDR